MQKRRRASTTQHQPYVPLVVIISLLLLVENRVSSTYTIDEKGTYEEDVSLSNIRAQTNNFDAKSNEQLEEHRKYKRRRGEEGRILNNIFLDDTEESISSKLQLLNKYRVDEADYRSVYIEESVHQQPNNNKLLPTPRIINGILAPETRYPYSVSLQYNTQHFCGGTLVSPNLVITAAHCTSTPTKITLGRYDLDSSTDYDYEVMDVVDIIVHPQYDESVVENDIALLVIERDSKHPYIQINTNNESPVDEEKLIVMGWGDIDSSDYGQETSDRLRETDVWYMTNSKCEESDGYVKTNEGVLYGSYEGSIKDSMLCAIDYFGTTSDACQGDSGGALVKTGSEFTEDVLVGLVSWGFGCADPNFPGVYSRLSYYFEDFLKPTICTKSLNPPSYLNCNGNTNVSTPITPSPTPLPAGLLTIFIDTDPQSPEDLGWELSSVSDGQVIASRPIGSYRNKYQQKISEEILVTPERFYRLEVFDRDSDGFKGKVSIVQGREYIKTEALVYEPGFSAVSGSSISHGFYVGDNPPRELTLDLKFDSNPEHVAWSITNVKDDLPLGFRWFDWYGNIANSIRARETIPIYGNDRGQQQYVFTILDIEGNGMCCTQGQGSFSLYLGEPVSGNLIVTGGEFTTEKTFTFDVDSIGVSLSVQPEEDSVSNQPEADAQVTTYYMSSSTGICQVNDESKPAWVTSIYMNYDECCSFSWNKQPCLSAKPIEATPPISDEQPIPMNNPSEPINFDPVTGSFTCREAGLSCTISCSQCGSIKRVASQMTMDYPNESTIIYTAEKGTNDNPEEPSRLILVESDLSAGNVISCDEGCTCDTVNDSVLGCGLVSTTPSTDQQPAIGLSPTQPQEFVSSGVLLCPSMYLIPIMLLVWMAVLR